MKKFTLSATIIIILGALPSALIAAQGDVEGYFTGTLDRIWNDFPTKKCEYRANISVLRDHSYQDYSRVYGITMSTGFVAQVNGRPIWIRDYRSIRANDPLKIEYRKTIMRYSDCPESIRLIYNSLTQEIRER